MVANRNVGFKT